MIIKKFIEYREFIKTIKKIITISFRIIYQKIIKNNICIVYIR